MTTQPEQSESMSRDEFVQFVRDATYAVVATVGDEGRPEAALVEILPADDGTLIFQSKKVSRKVANLAQNDRVALVIGTGSPTSLQLEGTVEQLSDDEQASVGRTYAETFPKRPPVGEMFPLFRVRLDWMRRYDEQPGQPPRVVEGLPR